MPFFLPFNRLRGNQRVPMAKRSRHDKIIPKKIIKTHTSARKKFCEFAACLSDQDKKKTNNNHTQTRDNRNNVEIIIIYRSPWRIKS